MSDGSNFILSGWVHDMIHEFESCHGSKFIVMGKVF